MEPYRAVSAFGAFALLGVGFLLSRERKAVRVRTVIWGVVAQWVMGLLLLRAPQGRVALSTVSGWVQKVLDQAYLGSSFVFGSLGAQGGTFVFAFEVLTMIIFVASLFSVLYHLGVMQTVVRGMAWVMMRTMHTSGAESLSIAASVFMGQTEAPLTIRPFLKDLTESELFTVMVGGMASVSGAVLGAYVMVGKVPMEHLLTAVAMTAPISIAMAKLVVPETATPKTANQVSIEVRKINTNVLDAAASGASDGLKLAVNVGAMLVAFIALVGLVNLVLGLVPIAGEPLTLERLLGWLCMPLALLMGTPLSEAGDVATVLGTRTIVNEMVAFERLQQAAETLSPRSQAIATVAICGFANLSSIGIMIGGLGGLVPERKQDIARLGVLALVAATLANFTSACVTGALLP